MQHHPAGLSSVLICSSIVALASAAAHAQSVASDFNGDGYADIAIGTPDEGLGDMPRAGVVHIMNGSAGGLKTTGHRVWHQDMAGIAGVAEPYGLFAAAPAWGDLNGDGFHDLALGGRGATIAGKANAGAVTVMFGSSQGITAAKNKQWHPNVSALDGNAEEEGHFGYAVAINDFNGDGFGDLAIGEPGKTINGKNGAGAVHILYGSPTGPKTIASQFWHQDVPGVVEASQAGDFFGRSLATGDFNGDGYADLAIGVPGERIAGKLGAGAVHIFYGSSQGLRTVKNQVWSLDSANILAVAHAADAMGTSLAIGDFNGDGFDDLAAGIPSKAIAGQPGAGAVIVIRGSSTGLTHVGNRFWHANNLGNGNSAAAGDSFGWRMAAGDINGDGRADLVIGIPNREVDSLPRAGAVHVAFGFPNGLRSTNSLYLHEGKPNVLDLPEAHGRFGYAVAIRDFNGDGFGDLVVGAPYHSVNGVHEAGTMHVFYGGAVGVKINGNQLFHQNSPGMTGETAEVGDEFADYF